MSLAPTRSFGPGSENTSQSSLRIRPACADDLTRSRRSASARATGGILLALPRSVTARRLGSPAVIVARTRTVPVADELADLAGRAADVVDRATQIVAASSGRGQPRDPGANPRFQLLYLCARRHRARASGGTAAPRARRCRACGRRRGRRRHGRWGGTRGLIDRDRRGACRARRSGDGRSRRSRTARRGTARLVRARVRSAAASGRECECRDDRREGVETLRAHQVHARCSTSESSGRCRAIDHRGRSARDPIARGSSKRAGTLRLELSAGARSLASRPGRVTVPSLRFRLRDCSFLRHDDSQGHRIFWSLPPKESFA